MTVSFTALAMIPMKEGTKMLIVMSVGTTPLLSHSPIIYRISGNRITLGPKSFVSYQISMQIDPIYPLGLVSGQGIHIEDKV